MAVLLAIEAASVQNNNKDLDTPRSLKIVYRTILSAIARYVVEGDGA